MRTRRGRAPAGRLLGAVVVFHLTAFLLLTLKDPQPRYLLLLAAIPSLLAANTVYIGKIFAADRLLLTLVNFLCALGVLVLCRMDIEKGLDQAVNYGIGILAMLTCLLAYRLRRGRGLLVRLAALAAVLLMASPLLFGKEKNGALAWVSFAGVNFQPSEIVKIALVLVLSQLLSRRKMAQAYLFAGLCLGLLLLQKDLGTALLYYAVALIMIFSATGRFSLLAAGLAGASAGALLGYGMFSHVKKRVRIWVDPWYDYNGAGYQIVQSLIAMVNGGLWGVGLGVGNANAIPEYATDFIFPVILNEFGALFGICVILIYLLIFARGIGIALRARQRSDALLALGCSSFLALQTFVIIAGNIKMIPLTGVTLPFVSHGGTSLLSSLGIIGLLEGVAGENSRNLREDGRLASLGGTGA